jgi:2-C-methyl-D-erythritol 4-phosphate cytidylyltransferase
MLEWSLEAFSACDSIHSVVVAAPAGHVGDLIATHSDLGVVAGGATRAQSVVNALAAVGTELVAIHDAARPLVTPELVEALVADLEANPGAAGVIAAAPVIDTIKRASRAVPRLHSDADAVLSVGETLDREGLWRAQTPQVFRTAALREALVVDEAIRDAATDEAMLVERAGGTVLIHPCEKDNLKVTTPSDLRLAEALLSGAGR